MKKGEYRRCLKCGKEGYIFPYLFSNNYLCSRTCSMLFQHEQGTASGFKKGHTHYLKVKNRCKLFGDKNPSKRPEVRLKISLAKKGKMSEVSRKISSERFKKYNSEHKKEKSPHWIKDRSKVKINDLDKLNTEYKKWMMSVRERDGWKCQISDNNCKGRIECHHILRWSDFPELRYSINNGITLCHYHHPRKRAEETILVPWFQEIINNKILI